LAAARGPDPRPFESGWRMSGEEKIAIRQALFLAKLLDCLGFGIMNPLLSGTSNFIVGVSGFSVDRARQEGYV